MEYLNITNSEEEVIKEFRLLSRSKTVTVIIPFKRIKGLPMPDSSGSEKLIAEFKVMTCEEYWKVEKATEVIREEVINMPLGGVRINIIHDMDYQSMRVEMIRRLLVSWNIPVELNHEDDDGVLTEESLERVLSVSAPLISALLYEYETTFHIDQEEEKQIDKQSAILFSKNSRGVENACDAITLFCTIGSFWEKFGINHFEIGNLPYKDFVRLRIMISKENKATRSQSEKSGKSATKVSVGGKTRESRGTVINLASS